MASTFEPAASAPPSPSVTPPAGLATDASARRPTSASPAPNGDVTGPFQQCAIERFASGWTTLACPDANLVVYGGFSGRPSANFLRQTSGDYIGAWFSEPIAPIAGKREAWELTARKSKAQPGFFGDLTEPDSQGEILRQGTFTKARSKGAGMVGILCYAEAGTYEREHCGALTRRLLQDGVPGGAAPLQVRIAGVTLELRGKRCWSATPSDVYCYLDGGLHWKRGNAQEIEAFIKWRMSESGLVPRSNAERQKQADLMNSKKDTLLAYKQMAEFESSGQVTTDALPDYTLSDISQLRMTRHPSTCAIGSLQARCERIDYYGVLDHVVKYQYIAVAADPDGPESVAIACQHSSREVAPLACREMFGDFVQPPTRSSP